MQPTWKKLLSWSDVSISHMPVPVFMEAADGADSVQLQLDTPSSAEEKVL